MRNPEVHFLEKIHNIISKGAGNIEYGGDIENGEIEKTGTSKKKWGTKF